MAAVSAYEAAFAMTVPPPVIAANRSQTMALIATNILGQNTPAIAASEAQYAEMWAQDSAAMQGYASSSAAASKLRPFTLPPQTTNPAGLAGQAATVAQAAAPAAAAAAPLAVTPLQIGSIGDGALIGLNLVSLASLAISCSILGQGAVGLTDQHRGETSPSVAPGAVEEPNLATAALMSRPGSGAAVSAFTGGASSIGELSVPPSWATPAAIRQVVAALPSTAVPIVMQNSQTQQPLHRHGVGGFGRELHGGSWLPGRSRSEQRGDNPRGKQSSCGDRSGGEQTGPSSGARSDAPGDARGSQSGVPLGGPGRDLGGGHTGGRSGQPRGDPSGDPRGDHNRDTASAALRITGGGP